MNKRTLDRKKDYQELVGVGYNYKYIQDGVHYDTNGIEVEPLETGEGAEPSAQEAIRQANSIVAGAKRAAAEIVNDAKDQAKAIAAEVMAEVRTQAAQILAEARGPAAVLGDTAGANAAGGSKKK